jgi:predicted HicB family RNase H-like nuclease
MKKAAIKAKAARYLKIVEWSDEDGCFVGRIPGLAAGGVHGDDEAKVYRELCDVTEEWIEILEKGGKPLPEPTAGRKFSGRFVVRVDPETHQSAALRAAASGLSLNQYVASALRQSATGHQEAVTPSRPQLHGISLKGKAENRNHKRTGRHTTTRLQHA